MPDQDHADLANTLLVDHEQHRTVPDRTWTSGMPESTKLVIKLYECLLYGSDHGQCLRGCVRVGKQPTEV